MPVDVLNTFFEKAQSSFLSIMTSYLSIVTSNLSVTRGHETVTIKSDVVMLRIYVIALKRSTLMLKISFRSSFSQTLLRNPRGGFWSSPSGADSRNFEENN
jgi:hypothetical protein